MIYKDLLDSGIKALVNSDTPRLDAEILLSHAAGINKLQLITNINDQVLQGVEEKYQTYLKRRQSYEPIAYIIGIKEFYGYEFYVTPSVLVPRPETELLVDLPLDYIKKNKKDEYTIVDLGTGSGCIGISLALELIKRGIEFELYLIDNSLQSLEVAKKNLIKFNLNDQVNIFKSDWFSSIPIMQRFDLIISNPPYVKVGEDKMSPETLLEPKAALYAGADGLTDIKKIVYELPNRLEESGVFLCEIGKGQSQLLKELYGVSFDLSFYKDLAGIDRVMQVRMLN